MKHTIFITQECNLACAYCYVAKQPAKITPEVAALAVDFIYAQDNGEENIQIGLFGGEPLLEFGLVREVTGLIREHPGFDPARVEISLVSNGTIFSPQIAEFIKRHNLGLCISCDGPAQVHDRYRRFKDGRPSSPVVERTIKESLETIFPVLVNAVYTPDTLEQLPRTVEYFSSLGVTHIYLNPDFSAAWEPKDLALLPRIYKAVADLHVSYHLAGTPHFISLIDSKIAVMLRGGYEPRERCRMGRGEFAYTVIGDIYPCERLVSQSDNGHRMGNLEDGVDPGKMQCHLAPGSELNPQCQKCSLKDFCMNWCGCSNFLASGFYNRVNHFICASEKAAIEAAMEAYQTLEKASGHGFDDYVHAALNPV